MSSRGWLYFDSISLNIQNVPYKTQHVVQTSINSEANHKSLPSPCTAMDTSQCLLSHLAIVHWLASVLLAVSYVVILYLTTRFFHEKGFMCGEIYFLWVKHGSNRVDVLIVKAVKCRVLRTNTHCKKVLCVCQSHLFMFNVSKMKWGRLFFEETAG